MALYSIDFETFYEAGYSVSDMGYHEYARDPRGQIICVAIYGGGVEYVGAVENAPWNRIAGHEWVSRNAIFDFCVYKYMYRKGDYTIKPSIWHDSAGLAAYIQCPRSLKGSVEATTGRSVDKQIRADAKGKTRSDLEKLGELKAYEEYCFQDAKLDYEFFSAYQHLWPEHERKLSNAHIQWSDRGIAIDVGLLEANLVSLEKQRAEIRASFPWLHDYKEKLDTMVARGELDSGCISYVNTFLEIVDTDCFDREFADFKEKVKKIKGVTIKSVTPPKVLSPKEIALHAAVEGFSPPPNTKVNDAWFEKWCSKVGDKCPWALKVNDYRSLTKLKANLTRLKSRTHEGIANVYMKYCGTHTRRVSGDRGFNILALPRSEAYGVDVRKLFIPRKGNKVVTVDLAQIEPRVMAWLCKDTKFLDFCKKNSPYEAHARATMGWTAGELKKEDPQLYSLAKARILGLQFGCGAEKFVHVAKMMAGLDITLEESEKVVEDFRSTALCKKIWELLDRRLRASVGGRFFLKSPNGAKLWYYDVTRLNVEGRPKYKVSYEIGVPAKYDSYGARLSENLVQWIAREVFCEKVLRVMEEYPEAFIWFTPYDELVCEVPEWCIERVYEGILRIFKDDCWFMKGLPLDAEGGVHETYVK